MIYSSSSYTKFLSKKKVLILGAGGFAREVWTWLGEPKCLFYSELAETEQVCGMPVLNPTNLERYKNDISRFYIGVGDPKLKLKLTDQVSNFGIHIAPALVIPKTSKNNRFGLGSIVCPGTVITTNVTLGIGVTININCTIGHDTKIGAFSTVSPGSNISGNCHIEENVYIGTGSSIREKIKVGFNSTVGMGSVVVKDVPNCITVIGNPAKPKQ